MNLFPNPDPDPKGEAAECEDKLCTTVHHNVPSILTADPSQWACVPAFKDEPPATRSIDGIKPLSSMTVVPPQGHPTEFQSFTPVKELQLPGLLMEDYLVSPTRTTQLPGLLMDPKPKTSMQMHQLLGHLMEDYFLSPKMKIQLLGVLMDK